MIDISSHIPDHELPQKKRIIQFYSDVNQAILDSKSVNELFDKICKAIISTGQFGVSIFRNEHLTINLNTNNRPTSSDSYISSFENHNYINEQIDDINDSNQLAIPYFYSNNIATDPRMSQWKTEIIRTGYQSVFAIPIFVNHYLICTINIYSPKIDFFTDEEINVLLQLRDLIPYCLNAINNTSLNQDLEHQKAQLLNDLIQKNDALNNFAYILSHNIRSHVANIMSLNNFLAKEKIEGKAKEYIEHITTAARNLDTVVKDVSAVINFKNVLLEARESIIF